jgi:hypothetical protein
MLSERLRPMVALGMNPSRARLSWLLWATAEYVPKAERVGR